MMTTSRLMPQRDRLTRAALCLGLLSAVLLAGPLSAQPPAVTGLYEEIRIAIELEDTESIANRFAPLMRIGAALGGGWLRELSTIFTQQENIAVEMRFDDFELVGQKALALVTWALSGTTEDTGEAWSSTVQRADSLIQQGGVWQMLGSGEVDREALRTKVTEGQFLDPDNGLEVTAPPKWRVIPLAGLKTAVSATSPDLSASVSWIVTDLPGTFTSEQLARGQADAVQKLAPTLGIVLRDVSTGPDTLAGRPAYRVRRTVVADDGVEVYSDVTYCVVGSTLYLCARSGMPPASYRTHEQEIDRSVATTKIVEVQAAELPPEAGRVEEGKYINDVYGCEITAPQGWDIKIGESQFKLQVTMTEPGGDSNITLGMIELPVPEITAEIAIKGDDDLSEKAFDGFKLIKRGETMIGDLPAFESISAFDFGGQARHRHRVYLVDNDRLFFMFADAAPADKWDRLSPLFTEAFGSFKLIEAQPIE